MRGLFDYHSHSHYCDGRGDLADYVEQATSMGLDSFGLSGHAPCPITSDWHMKAADLGAYLEEGRAIREASRLDFVIGSVHYLERLADGTPWTVDGPAEELQRGVRESFGGDARSAVRRYFDLVAEMAAADRPDVIGHIDLIRKNNDGLFDAETAWYREAVEEALAVVAGASCVVEINTGAVSRGYRAGFYPADGVLAAMARRRIPVTLGSDAHRPGDVAAHFAAALYALARAGYRECWRLGRAGWSAVALESLGGGVQR